LVAPKRMGPRPCPGKMGIGMPMRGAANAMRFGPWPGITLAACPMLSTGPRPAEGGGAAMALANSLFRSSALGPWLLLQPSQPANERLQARAETNETAETTERM
jgi:hypothetical protein